MRTIMGGYFPNAGRIHTLIGENGTAISGGQARGLPWQGHCTRILNF